MINTCVKQRQAMIRKLLHEVRDVLKQADAIASESKFCERLLGKDRRLLVALKS